MTLTSVSIACGEILNDSAYTVYNANLLFQQFAIARPASLKNNDFFCRHISNMNKNLGDLNS